MAIFSLSYDQHFKAKSTEILIVKNADVVDYSKQFDFAKEPFLLFVEIPRCKECQKVYSWIVDAKLKIQLVKLCDIDYSYINALIRETAPSKRNTRVTVAYPYFVIYENGRVKEHVSVKSHSPREWLQNAGYLSD